MSYNKQSAFNKFKVFHIVLVENNIPLPQTFVEILLKIEKTGLSVKLLRGTCVTCKRNRSLIVSDPTITAEGLGDFFKHIGKAARNVGKKTLNNPARALEISANIGTAAASKNPKLIAATAPEVIKFVHQGKGFVFGKNSLNIFNKCIQFSIGVI